jgi:hypothetical protein
MPLQRWWQVECHELCIQGGRTKGQVCRDLPRPATRSTTPRIKTFGFSPRPKPTQGPVLATLDATRSLSNEEFRARHVGCCEPARASDRSFGGKCARGRDSWFTAERYEKHLALETMLTAAHLFRSLRTSNCCCSVEGKIPTTSWNIERRIQLAA